MKKLFFALLVLAISVLMFVSIAFAGEKTIRLNWGQNIPSDFLGWEVHKGTTAGGPYTYLTDIPYSAQQSEYTSDQVIIAPDGATTTIYIVLVSLDTSGNPSPYSNEASVTIDFEAPEAAFSLTITIVTD